MNYRLGVACFWGVLGAGLLLWHAHNPNAPFGNVLGSRVSSGWLAIVLGVYSLVRWWAYRQLAKQRSQEQQVQRPQRQVRPLQPPDPTFDFTRPQAGTEAPPADSSCKPGSDPGN